VGEGRKIIKTKVEEEGLVCVFEEEEERVCVVTRVFPGIGDEMKRRWNWRIGECWNWG